MCLLFFKHDILAFSGYRKARKVGKAVPSKGPIPKGQKRPAPTEKEEKKEKERSSTPTIDKQPAKKAKAAAAAAAAAATAEQGKLPNV